MAHIGRNDPCPCGSGKKYKRCCQDADAATARTVRPLHDADNRLVGDIAQYAVDRYGGLIFRTAWCDFTGEDDPDDVDPDEVADAPEAPAFMAWLAYVWLPNPDRAPDRPDDWPAHTLARDYLAISGPDLTHTERRVLDASVQRPLSFYAVRAVVPGRRMTLDDVLTGHSFDVIEQSASRADLTGAIFYGRVLPLDDVTLLAGASTLVIPPGYHPRLVDLRDDLAGPDAWLTEPGLLDYDHEIRDAYWEIVDSIYNPRPPRLANTDGDPLEHTTLQYALHCTPQDALDALADLALDRADEVHADATRAPDGAVQAASFAWLRAGNAMHADLDVTSIASIAIDGPSLVVTVNSARRADNAREEIARRLGDRAVLERTSTESIEDMLARLDEPDTPEQAAAREENERLNALPEVQEHIRAMTTRHYEQWVDEPLPALRGQTPREATTTPVGRELLEALLADMEQMVRRNPGAPTNPDVAALRRTLGL